MTAVARAATTAAQPIVPVAAATPALHFLMRLYTPLFAPTPVHEQLLVFHPREGGSVEGPRIRGTLEQPGGDWVRTLADGSLRIDVRLLIRLDDGCAALMSYGGVLAKPDEESWQGFLAGALIEAPLWHYVVAPTFETGSQQYAWLNRVQAVGKFVSIQTGPEAHVAFDIYEVR